MIKFFIAITQVLKKKIELEFKKQSGIITWLVYQKDGENSRLFTKIYQRYIDNYGSTTDDVNSLKVEKLRYRFRRWRRMRHRSGLSYYLDL